MPYLIIFAFSCVCMLPNYIFGIMGLDLIIHGIWIKEFSELLSQGIIFPKFGHNMFQGMGGYTYFFYPPLYLYVAAIFTPFATDEHLFSQALLGSAHVATFFICLNCYIWLSSKMPKNQALILALFYTISPALMYKFYLTAQIGTLWGAAWYPLILLSLEKISNSKTNGFAILCFGVAMLLLSNIPAVIVFMPFAGLYFLLLKPKYKQMLLAGGACLLAGGIAAYFIVPMAMMMSEVNIDLHWDKKYGYHYDKLLFGSYYVSQLYKEPYRLLFLVIQIILVLNLAYIFFHEKKNSSYIQGGLLFLAIVSLFITTDMFRILWDLIPFLQKVQFPDRFQIVTSLLCLIIISNSKKSFLLLAKVNIILMIFIIFLFKFAGVIDIKNIDKRFRFEFDNKIVSFPVHQPKAKDILQHFYFTPHKKIIPPPHAEFVKGSGKIGEVVWNNRDLSVNYLANEDATIKVNRFYINGWEAEINGKPVPIKFEENMGVMLVDAPKCSDCTLKIWLPMLLPERIGYIISAISLFIFITILAYRKKCPAIK